MPLTVKKIQSLKPQDKLYRVADGDGLCLEVTPKGSKLWRLRYRFGGKAKMMALGKYDDLNLQDARTKCRTLKQLLGKGIDPAESSKAEKDAESGKNIFEPFAREWFERFKHKWVERTAKRKMRRLEGHVFPLKRCPDL